MNAGRSPSRSGQTTKCQWLGIKPYAHNRIRRVGSVSSTTRSNAKKSSSLVKSSLRPTPRLSTWKTMPPGECRLGRDIHGFLSRYPSFVNLVAVTFSLPRSLPIAGEGSVRVESSLATVAGSASFSEERSQGDPDPRGYHGRGGKRLALEPMGSKWPRKRDLQGVRRS